MAEEGWLTKEPPEVYMVLMELHDFLAFASREISGVAVTAPLIHNSALNYAVNRIDKIHRVASGPRPSYLKDFAAIMLYATPAYMLGRRLPNGKWAEAEAVKITYNAVNTVLQVTEEFGMNSGGPKLIKIVLPRKGAYVTYPPKTIFRFFTIGGNPPSIVRIGKKNAQARLIPVKADEVKILKGKHMPDHPVNPIDLPRYAKILSATMEAIPPWPLLTSARLECEYVEATFEDPLEHRARRFKITLPSLEVYRSLLREA